ncbi:hypothetical protein B0A50_00331 [Salinomyces thailandicus]|uniref:Transcription elongation factor Eaf N-terminal domain-containing protein n=1 Tax=Salinomyces thailandicus TaxID=706561 RepID=A0A4U0UFL0_9PEZI|nr:hypothetical protein B0A50_00331 [Salinomyces thailandica]
MAAASAALQPVDVSKPGHYPIRLGSSITSPSKASKPYVNVRYNYKPQSLPSEAPARLRPIKASSNKAIKLEIQDGDWVYEGTAVADVEEQYVLILRENAGKQEAVLEKLWKGYDFNLSSTHDKLEDGVLRQRYPHIGDAEQLAEAHGLPGEDGEEDEPLDPDNPFDYRHHLKAALVAKAKRPTEASQSTTSTPLTQHTRAATTTPVAKPAQKRQNGSNLFTQQQKKRKAPPTSAAAAKESNVGSNGSNKRVKAGHEPYVPPTARGKAETSSTRAKTEAPPEIRVDRKASVREPSFEEESGELIIENGDADSAGGHALLGRQGAMALALSGQFRQGPISLRSAASSPASHIASPAPPRPGGLEDGEEFELGGSSPEESGRTARHKKVDVEEEDQDADVEDLELPSPAAEHRPSVSAATVTSAHVEEEEDDLDAQLAAAMAEEDTGGVVEEPEEEEESEEE